MRKYDATTALHRSGSRVGLASILLVAAFSCGAQNAPDPALAKTFNALVTAARNSDDATIAKYLSPNVTVIDGSGLSRGRVSYLARARSMPSENAGHGALRDFRVHDVGIHQIGDMGWITYTYRLNAPPASGKGPRREIFGFATLILQKVAGRWQIVHAQTAGRAPKSTDPSF